MSIIDDFFGNGANGTNGTPSGNGTPSEDSDPEADSPSRGVTEPQDGDAASSSENESDSFGRRVTGAASANGSPARVTGVKYTFHTKEEPDADHPFAHGYIDGVENVDPVPFRQFLELNSEEERLEDELERLETEKKELRSREDGRIELEADIERDRVRLDAVERDLEEAEEAFAAAQGEDEPAKTQNEPAAEEDGKEAAPKHGSRIYALLYTFAGIVFIGGDIVMSKEVVSTALRLEEDIERWIFAIGLALLAVLIKPAYDRLVEKPYWQGNQSWFKATILISAFAAIATLFVLGVFRSQAYSIGKTVDDLTEQIKDLQDGEITEAERIEIKKLNDEKAAVEAGRFDSKWGMLSFVLSGILFAVAGAVCLGIGLGHFREWHHRRLKSPHGFRRIPVWWNTWSEKKAFRKTKEHRDTVRKKHETQEVTLRAKEKKLALMPSLNDLREQIQRINSQQEKLRAAYSIGRAGRATEMYHNGRDIARKVMENQHVVESVESGLPPDPSPSQETSQKPSPRRPFLAVRDAIAKNQPDADE